MIRFRPHLSSQLVCPTNVARITSTLNDYDSLVKMHSYTKKPILFVKQVQEVDVVEASYKYFTPRLLSVLSSDVWFEFWVRCLRNTNENKKLSWPAPMPNLTITRIWFDSRNVFAPSVKVLMERGDFDMNYVRSINIQHQFEDITN
jgi:hypothetical protein